MRWLAITATMVLFAAFPLSAAETEVVLEEGNVEIQLNNGVFVALAAGADVSIVHADDGAPEMIEIRAGSAQIISSFGDPADMVVRLGPSALTLGKGAAIFSVRPEGGVEAILLNGSPFNLKGGGSKGIRPGERVRIDKQGDARKDKMPKGELRGRGRAFGKPPPKQDQLNRRSNSDSETWPIGEDAGLENRPLRRGDAKRVTPKLRLKGERPRISAPKPPRNVDTAVQEQTDKALNALQEMRNPGPPQGQPPGPPQGQPPGPQPPRP